MKGLYLLLGMMLSTITIFAQGINFEKGSWKEVVAKAKAEKKLIYLDVYAEWCGPCKMMARDVFPNEKSGEKYNKLFINYKIDAEKGEGRDVARQYGVSSYPTNLYINPNDESVVYRIAGACGVDEFLKRADIAQLDFSDPMSWEDYEAKLKKNPKDYQFLQTYMGKAGRLGKANDAGIDAYVTHHMTIPPHDSNIYFLVMNTQTFDNKGYTVLKANQARVDAMIPDPRHKFEEREKSTLFQGTFKKAVANNDIKVMETIKPILFRYNKVDSIGKWFWAEQLFYATVKDEKQLMNSYKNTIKYYSKFDKKQLLAKDALLMEENISNLKAQAKFKNQTEDQFAKSIEGQKKVYTFSNAFTSNAINANLTATKHVLETENKNKKLLKEADKWIDNSLALTDINQPSWESAMQMKALIQYYQGNQKEANAIATNLVNELTTHKKSTKASQEFLDKLKSGEIKE